MAVWYAPLYGTSLVMHQCPHQMAVAARGPEWPSSVVKSTFSTCDSPSHCSSGSGTAFRSSALTTEVSPRPHHQQHSHHCTECCSVDLLSKRFRRSLSGSLLKASEESGITPNTCSMERFSGSASRPHRRLDLRRPARGLPNDRHPQSGSAGLTVQESRPSVPMHP